MAGAPDQVAPPRETAGIVERAMDEIAAAARRDRHGRLARPGTPGYLDPEAFASVDGLLRRAVERERQEILLPELLDDPDGWRLQTALEFASHRPVIGPALVFVKRRLLLPITRWLFDYSRENFNRQQRINRILAAAIEELAFENAGLRREVAELKKKAVEP